MHLLPFLVFTTIGAGMWNIILAAMGYIAHGQASLIDKYSKEISLIAILAGGLFVLYLFYNGFVKKIEKLQLSNWMYSSQRNKDRKEENGGVL
jgi:membrane protein DedA with SNARE-associated domain